MPRWCRDDNGLLDLVVNSSRNVALSVIVQSPPRSDRIGAPKGIPDRSSTAPLVSEDLTTTTMTTTTTARSTPSTPPPSDAAAASEACLRHSMMNGAANGRAAPAAVGMKRCAPSTSSSSSPHVVSPAKKKAKKSCPERKKAPDAPRRPLSAYNIFFLVERERLLNDNSNDQDTFTYTESLVEEAVKANLKGAKLKKKRSHRKSHGKIAFKDLATAVSERWKVLSTENKALFEKYATHERNKYKKLMEVWQKQRKKEVVVDPDQEDSAVPPKAVTSSSCSSLSRTPAPPCVGPEPAKIVSPSADDITKPLKIIDATLSPHVPSFAPRDDSLTAMMRRGNAYATLLSQKQAELELRNSMLDHMQMIMGYSVDAAVAPEQYTSYDHRGQYVSQSVPISSNAMDVPAYAPYVEYNSNSNNSEPVDFYDAAEATFQLAHRVLPPPPAQCFSNPINASYATQPSSHVNCYENSSPFVDSYENRSVSQAFHHHHHHPAQVSRGNVYECNTTPAVYNDVEYNMVVHPNQQHMMYDASCEAHAPAYEPYVPPQQEATFPTAMPAVRSLPSYEPTTAFGLDESSDEEEDDDHDDDNVDNTSVVGVDIDDESIMGVLNPSADPFSLACVFE